MEATSRPVSTALGPSEAGSSAPPVPESLEQTGLSQGFLSDLILRTLYFRGSRTGEQLERTIKLPFSLLDEQLMRLQQRRLLEVLGTEGRGRLSYVFEITGEGRTRCREKLSTTRYVGPAPVTLEAYREWILRQKPESLGIDPERVRSGFSHLVLSEPFLDRLGPAINSGRSIFLYGHAGNGKTTIAETIAEMLGDAMYVPYAIETGGQVISVFDPINHRPIEPLEEEPGERSRWLKPAATHDARYVLIERPAVMVGGELTLDDLELRWDEQAGVFLAPPQMKANGGVFIIDDFGRQRVRPRDLLNRWMVPLERRVDFLSLPMGHHLPVPFECLLIYATNLDPTELVEEAFLRRIRYKILVDNPTPEQYREIFRRCCASRELEYSPDAVAFIEREYYAEGEFAPRSCHPRDIVNHLCDLARYRGVPPRVSEELIALACKDYFLESPTAEGAPGAPGGRESAAVGGLAHWGHLYDG
ncbi:MAG: ATP-binding protein [Gemmatimonadota bacterium]